MSLLKDNLAMHWPLFVGLVLDLPADLRSLLGHGGTIGRVDVWISVKSDTT